MFTVDGVEWSIPCDIERVSEIRASEISGMLMDKTIFNDVLGTYLKYDVKLVPNPRQMADYYSVYEVLNAPVGSHSFVMPYNESTVTLTGCLKDIRDVYVRMPNGGRMWKGVRFSVIASAPTKTMSLTEAISNGLPPYPPVENPDIGDAYQYFADGWEEIDGLPDADSIAY